MTNLAVGDRVTVRLTERQARIPGRPYVTRDVPGTVEGVDNHPPHRGVEVRLARPVNGMDTCYATYGEVRKASAAT